MTATWTDIANGLRGIFRLARGRPDGIAAIGTSPTSVARSFWAVLLCLPLFVLLRALDWRDAGIPHAPLHAVGLDLIGYVVGWAGFALAARPILRRMGREAAWPRMVAVWNWCQVVQYGLLLIAAVPQVLRVNAAASEFAALVALGWALWIEWFSLRAVLKLPGPAVAGLVGLDVFIGILIDGVIAGLHG